MTTSRPTGITITAWLWIATGILMMLSGAMGAIVHSMTPPSENRLMANSGLAPEFAMMNFVFQNFIALVSVQIMVALVAVFAGVGLLRLKSWARTTIEALSWLGLAYIVGFSIFWLYAWTSITERMPSAVAPVGADPIQIMGALMGVVVTAMLAVPLVVMIWYLRGEQVRKMIVRA